MKDEKLITILVVTHNFENIVCETLDSALAQDYSRLELIITDDASTDNTAEVVKSWIKNNNVNDRFERVVLNVNPQNVGVSKNINIGISLAEGDYIQTTAGDDILFPECCREKLDHSVKYDQKLVYSRVEIFSNDGLNPLVGNCIQRSKKGYEILKSDQYNQFEEMVVYNYLLGPCGGFYETEFVRSVMRGYDERFPNLDDWPFHLKYLSMGYHIKLLDRELVRYRVNPKPPSRKEWWGLFERDCFNFFIQVRLEYLLKLKKYDIAINHWRDFEEKQAKKKDAEQKRFQMYCEEMCKWMELTQSGHFLDAYLKDNGYRSVAIYGVGKTGRLLLKELTDRGVGVLYIIDKLAEQRDFDVAVFRMEDDLPEVDAIIVTPTYAFDDIWDALSKKTTNQIISLHEIIDREYAKLM